MKKLNAKQYAELLFSKNKRFLDEVRLSEKTSARTIASTAVLATLQLLPLINKIIQDGKSEIFLEKVLREYQRLFKQHSLGEDTALVKTAVPLTDKEVEKLGDQLAAIFGRYLKLEIEIDSDIIGGIVVKVGDKIIDRSVLGKLKGLDRHINKKKIPKK